MRNNIEILRAIIFDEEDLKNILNLGDSFSDKEIEFMMEFKKIYELGLNQLEKFINKLDEEGKDIEPWDIKYYVELLSRGPLAGYVVELSKDKKYFYKYPDTLAVLGNHNITAANTIFYDDTPVAFNTCVDTYNKMPPFVQESIITANIAAEDIFRSSFVAAIVNDNTLPLADKKPQERYASEIKGEWVSKPNATYMVKDNFYRIKTEEIRSKIFDKIKEYLGEDEYRLFDDNKNYNPFDSEKNDAIGSNFKIEKQVKLTDEIKETLDTDLHGQVFDSFKRRESVLKIAGEEKEKKFPLHTNLGQLGN